MNPKIILLTLSLIISFSFQSTAQNYTGKQKHIDKILENTALFSASFIAGDVETLANLYTIDGKILPPGIKIVEGRAAIKEKWILPEGMKTLRHKITPQEIKIIGKYAYDIGYYAGATQQVDGTESTWQGKYVIVWKKVNNDWKIDTDIWNNVSE